jgi:hypothetical protein
VGSVEPSPTPDRPDDGDGDDHRAPTGSGEGVEGERAEVDGNGAPVDGDDDADPTDGAGNDEVPEGSDPLRFSHWMKRSATGAVLTGIAIGLQQALETPRQQPAFVIEASDVPDPDGPIDLRFDPDDPSATVAIIRKPVDGPPPEPPASAG